MVKVTEEEIRDSVMDAEYIGVCVECGNRQGGCEPDAREYKCDACGALKVFGVEEAVLEGLVQIE